MMDDTGPNFDLPDVPVEPARIIPFVRPHTFELTAEQAERHAAPMVTADEIDWSFR